MFFSKKGVKTYLPFISASSVELELSPITMSASLIYLVALPTSITFIFLSIFI